MAHRDANGPFRSRKALKDVARLGPKAYEQCAGFLRIGAATTRWTAPACTRGLPGGAADGEERRR